MTPDGGYNRVADIDRTPNRADAIQFNADKGGINIDRTVDPDPTLNRSDYSGINYDRATDADKTLNYPGGGGINYGPHVSGGYRGVTNGYGGYGGVAGAGGVAGYGGYNRAPAPAPVVATPAPVSAYDTGDIFGGSKVPAAPIAELEQTEVEDDIEQDELFGAEVYEIESRPLGVPEIEVESEVMVEPEAAGEIETRLEKEVDLENEMVGEPESELEAELNFEVEATGEAEVAAESEPVEDEAEKEGELEVVEVEEPTIAMPTPPPSFGGMSLKDQLQAGQFGGKFRPGLGLAGLFQSGAIGGLGGAGSSFGVNGGFGKPTKEAKGDGITGLGKSIMNSGLGAQLRGGTQ